MKFRRAGIGVCRLRGGMTRGVLPLTVGLIVGAAGIALAGLLADDSRPDTATWFLVAALAGAVIAATALTWTYLRNEDRRHYEPRRHVMMLEVAQLQGLFEGVIEHGDESLLGREFGFELASGERIRSLDEAVAYADRLANTLSAFGDDTEARALASASLKVYALMLTMWAHHDRQEHDARRPE